MASYFRLDRRILTSSLWVNGDAETIRLWLYLLLTADRHGIVEATVPAIAMQNRLTADRVRQILARLAEPDPDSRTPDEDGRRLVVEVAPQFRIRLINYERYQRVDYTAAERQRRHRRRADDVTRDTVTSRVTSRHVTVSHGESRDVTTKNKNENKNGKKRERGARTEPGEQTSRSKARPAGVEEVRAYLAELGVRTFTAETFVDWHEARGWRLKSGPVKDWRACVRTWMRRDGGQAKTPRLGEYIEGRCAECGQPSGLTICEACQMKVFGAVEIDSAAVKEER